MLEPSTPLVWGWHLDALCSHVQAQLEGWARRQSDPTYEQSIQNFLATLPPGTAKSKALVIASAWAWARWPSMRMLAISGNPRIALRDSMLFRQLVTSRWYLDAIAPTWTIRVDDDSKGSLGNTVGGVRLAMGWDARAVGEHVDWIQADDPHDPEQIESDAIRAGVLEKWDGSWANRVNDLASSIRTGIAQRTGESDWSAARIAEGWVHLDLPMLHELDRLCETPLGRPDPRTSEGECLHPARFTPEVIAKERKRVGERRWATLYQGRPAPKGGAMVKVADVRFWRHDAAPQIAARPKGCYAGPAVVVPTSFDAIVIAGDLAGGKLTLKGDYNALGVFGKKGSGFYLIEFWVKRAGFPEVQAKVRELAAKYPRAKKTIESAASGASLVASLEAEISGLVGKVASGDKESRLESVLAFFEAGNVYLPDGAPGIDALIASLTTFPNASHDDDVDMISLALAELSTVKTTDWSGFAAVMSRVATAPPTSLGENEYSFGAAASAFSASKPQAERESSPRERASAIWARRNIHVDASGCPVPKPTARRPKPSDEPEPDEPKPKPDWRHFGDFVAEAGARRLGLAGAVPCDHDFREGRCDRCGYLCTHPDADGRSCPDCGETFAACPGHLWLARQGEGVRCTRCNARG
ncbi:MAG TPA: phage terminase large subunit [Kofleriaceae bacterium]